MKKITSTILGFAILLFLNIAHANSSQGNLIVFGDSLSDNGNNTWVFATGAPITSLDEEGNRFTWVNYLAKKLFNNSVYPIHEVGQDKSRILSNNINYAYASADTSNDFLAADWPDNKSIPTANLACKNPGLLKNSDGKVISSCVPGLLNQVEAYLNDVHHTPNSNTLFFIWAGGNDLFYKLPLGVSPKDIITVAVSNIVNAKNKLIASGISPKNIYVLNLPDLSKSPYAIEHSLQLTELTIAFNTTLQMALTTSVNGSTNAPLQVSHIISIFDLLNEMTAAPTQYNFSNLQESCVKDAEIPLCKGFLFYDGKHPTATAHHYIADYVSSRIER